MNKKNWTERRESFELLQRNAYWAMCHFASHEVEKQVIQAFSPKDPSVNLEKISDQTLESKTRNSIRDLVNKANISAPLLLLNHVHKKAWLNWVFTVHWDLNIANKFRNGNIKHRLKTLQYQGLYVYKNPIVYLISCFAFESLIWYFL